MLALIRARAIIPARMNGGKWTPFARNLARRNAGLSRRIAVVQWLVLHVRRVC